MRNRIVLILMFFVILGQLPGFIRAMKNKQTARCWFIGFVITLLTGCWIIYFTKPGA